MRIEGLPVSWAPIPPDCRGIDALCQDVAIRSFVDLVPYRSGCWENLRDRIVSRGDPLYFIQAGLPREALHYLPDDPTPVLQHAFRHADPTACLWLLERGADLSAIDLSSVTPFQQRIFEWLQNVQRSKDLQWVAETWGIGYKAAHLLVLQELCPQLQEELHTVTVSVPTLCPIADIEIQAFLRRHYPLWEEDWAKFIDRSRTHGTESAEACAVLRHIAQGIRRVFASHTFRSVRLRQWIETHRPELVMVRSTGMEDSQQLANAGGNQSVPCVATTEKALSSAIGQVVASYFFTEDEQYPRSIQQRLATGDTSVLSSPPSLPVLIQTMICEDVHGPLRSGVLLTEDPAKKDGVSVIQSAFGNNHGVVSGRVVVDTTWVSSDGDCYQLIRHKPRRFVEDSRRRSLVQTENAVNLTETATLDPELVRDLKLTGDWLSRMYATGSPKPLDIEFSLKPTEQGMTLFLLQARPVVRSEKQLRASPTFIRSRFLEHVEPENLLLVETLLDGGGSVAKVAEAEEVLAAADIPLAYRDYLHSAHHQKIQLVLTRRPAPVTSHECVTLDSEGVISLVVRDRKKVGVIEDWLDQLKEGSAIWVDPQRGLLIRAKDAALAEGWVSYPIPPSYSVPTDGELQRLLLEDPKLAVERVAELDARCLQMIQTYQGEQLEPYTNLGKLYEQVALGEPEQALEAVACLLRLSRDLWVKVMKAQGPLQSLIAREYYSVLRALVEECEKALIPAIQSYPPGSPHRVFPLRFVQALFNQSPEGVGVNRCSLGMVLWLIRVQGELEGAGVSPLLMVCRAFKRHGLSRLVQSLWEDFAETLESEALDALLALIRFVEHLDEVDLATTWMNTVFPRLAREHQGLALWEEIQADVQRNQEELDRCLEEREQIMAWEEEVALWKNLEVFSSHWRRFHRMFEPYFKQGNIIKRFRRAPRLARIAILENLRRLIALCDQQIKTVEAARAKEDERVAAMATLLQPFFGLMQTCAHLLPKNDLKQLVPSGRRRLSFDAYVSRLVNGGSYSYLYQTPSIRFLGLRDLVRQGRQRAFDEPLEQLEARVAFNVRALMLGSGADVDYSAHWPTRLAEYFTLAHQNAEAIRKRLLMLEGIDSQLLDGVAKEWVTELSEELNGSVSHICTDDQGNFEAFFQVPLRQHAADVLLKWKSDEEAVTLTLHVLGGDEHRRWDQTAAACSLWASLDPAITLIDWPDIDYREVDGVEVSLRLRKDGKGLKEAVGFVKYLFEEVSMCPTANSEILGRLEEIVALDGAALQHPRTYRYALQFANILMRRFLEEEKYQEATAVIQGTIEGMVHYHLPDYARANLYVLKDAEAYTSERFSRRSVSRGILAAMTTLRQKGEGAALLEQLVADKRLKRQFPLLHKGLELCKESLDM